MGRRVCIITVVLAGIVFVGALFTSPAETAVKPQDFYKGQRITLVVPYTPGGGFDAYARLLAPFLQQALEAKVVVVANKPGGGGYRAANWMYLQAPRDGRTLAIVNGQTLVVNELFGVTETAEFKSVKEFSIIAAWAGLPLAVLINSKLPYHSAQDFKGATGLKGGTTDPLGTHAISDAVVAEAFNLQDFRIIAGYSSTSSLITAVMRGELDLFASSYDTCKRFVDQGFARCLTIISPERVSLFPDTATIYEIGMPPEANKWVEVATTTRNIMRLFVAPPGTPDEKVKYLSNVFWKITESKEFQQEMKKREMVLHLPADAKEATARLNKVLGMSDEDKKKFRYLVEKKYR